MPGEGLCIRSDELRHSKNMPNVRKVGRKKWSAQGISRLQNGYFIDSRGRSQNWVVNSVNCRNTQERVVRRS